jgi:hypothetical protein
LGVDLKADIDLPAGRYVQGASGAVSVCQSVVC